METSTTRIAFSVKDILNLPESKEKELDGSMKGLSNEEDTDRTRNKDERKDLNEATLKGKIIIHSINFSRGYCTEVLFSIVQAYSELYNAYTNLSKRTSFCSKNIYNLDVVR